MPKGSSSSSSKCQQLIDACSSGNIAAVRTLLDKGVDVNWKDTVGDTALLWAAVEGRVEVVKLLLDRGALTDLRNSEGGTAFIYACCNGYVECARLLLERGADMAIKDKDGKTAKDQAVEEGHNDIVQLLEEYEAKKKTTPQTKVLTEVALPQAHVVGELVMEPINKALQEENTRLKIENGVLKERELSKNKEMLLKQELLDEYKARSKCLEEENQSSKDEVATLKEKEIRVALENEYLKRIHDQLRLDNEYLKRRDEELRLERNTERAERSSERAMFQTMMSSLISGTEDRKRKRDEDEATK